MKFHVNEIYGMPRKGMASNMFNNGSLLQLGSAAYILINVANSLIKSDPVFGSDNLPKLGIAAGIFGLGKILQNTHKSYLQMGKKYRMVTLQM
jgi:hypothetical protein